MRNDSRSDFKKGATNYAAGSIGEKILLTSKSRSETRVQMRKPVKECYCIADAPKTNKRSSGTIDEAILSKNFGNNGNELVEIYSPANTGTARNSLVATLIGYETLRRAGRITYLPSSEFLRRVQKKVSCQRRKKPTNVCSEFSRCSSSDDLQIRFAGQSGEKVDAHEEPRSEGKNVRRGEKLESRNNYEFQPIEEQNRGRGQTVVSPKLSRSRSVCLEKRKNVRIRDRENIQRANVPRTKTRVASKKIASSVDCFANDKKPKSQRIVRTISAHGHCCRSQNSADPRKIRYNESVKVQPERIVNESGDNCECSIERCPATNRANIWQLSRDRIFPTVGDGCEERVRELSKFRRANYFETHGSVNTLVGTSRSTTTTNTDQCEFNDRIFPTPRCSSKTTKRIHYYPSYVVREERITSDTSCRKKIRSRSCDVIGHVVDLGILNIPCEFIDNYAFKCQRGGGDDE